MQSILYYELSSAISLHYNVCFDSMISQQQINLPSSSLKDNYKYK